MELSLTCFICCFLLVRSRHNFGLDCVSHRTDKPFTKGGAPFQYIHIPKSAGTTVQSLFRTLAKVRNVRFKVSNGLQGPCTNVTMKAGKVYAGHCPIRSTTSKRAVYAVSLREPISRWVSQYDYQASTRAVGPGFELYSNAEKELAKTGVKQSAMLSTFLQQEKNPVVKDLLKKSQFSFFVPPKCALRHLDDPHATTALQLPTKYKPKRRILLNAVVLQNLVRVELVVTLDNLDTLISQVNRHVTVPDGWLNASKSHLGHKNKVGHKRKKQILDAAVIDIMKNHPNYALEEHLYTFGKRVSEARVRYNACEAAGDKNCDKLCSVAINGHEKQLLEMQMPERYENCVVH